MRECLLLFILTLCGVYICISSFAMCLLTFLSKSNLFSPSTCHSSSGWWIKIIGTEFVIYMASSGADRAILWIILQADHLKLQSSRLCLPKLSFPLQIHSQLCVWFSYKALDLIQYEVIDKYYSQPQVISYLSKFSLSSCLLFIHFPPL